MTPADRHRICSTCEYSRPHLRGLCCLLLRDDAGRVSVERLAQVIDGTQGRCPVGRHADQTIMEGR